MRIILVGVLLWLLSYQLWMLCEETKRNTHESCVGPGSVSSPTPAAWTRFYRMDEGDAGGGGCVPPNTFSTPRGGRLHLCQQFSPSLHAVPSEETPSSLALLYSNILLAVSGLLCVLVSHLAIIHFHMHLLRAVPLYRTMPHTRKENARTQQFISRPLEWKSAAHPPAHRRCLTVGAPRHACWPCAAMSHSTQVDNDAGSLGRHGADAYPCNSEESEFDEGDWEEGEEQEEEEESDRCSSDSFGGDEDADDQEAEEELEREEQEEYDHGSSDVLEDDAKTEPPVAAATGSSGTFAAASPSAAASLSGGSGGSAFGALAASVEASPSAPLPTAPSVFASSPLASAAPPQPFSARMAPAFASHTTLQEQRPLNTALASPFQPTAAASAAATQQQLGTTTAPLHFVDFERSLGQKLSSSEWHRAHSKADEVQDVKRALARYNLVLPTDKFDEAIEKALYGS